MSRKTPTRSVGHSASCVALDLGATSVRAVEVEWTASDTGSSGVRVVRRGSAPVSSGIWNDLSLHRDSLVGAIQQALSAAGITARSVVACLPRRFVTLRLVHLPHASSEEMRGMVAFEAQQYVLYPLDEVILAFQVLSMPLNAPGMSDGDMDTVLLAAARKGLIAELMTVFDRAGLELRQLSVSALALAEHARDSVEPTALIDFETGELDVAVVANRQLLFTRASALEAQGMLSETTQPRILEEVVRSFAAYQNEFRNLPLAHVFTVGVNAAGHSIGWLEQALTEILELPVGVLHSRFLPTGDPDLRSYATATGMALQALPGSLAPINLVPGERAELRAQQARSQRQRLALVAVVIVLLAAAWNIRNALARQALERQGAFDANQKLDALNKRLATRQKAYDTEASLAKDLQKGLDRNHPVVDVMAALNSSLPQSPDIWLTQLSFSRGGQLTLRGNTKSAMMATDLVLALQKSGAFSQVRLSYLGDAQDTDTGGGSAGTTAAPNAGQGTTAATSAAPVTPLPGMTPGPANTSPGPQPPGGPGNGGASPPGPQAGTPPGPSAGNMPPNLRGPAGNGAPVVVTAPGSMPPNPAAGPRPGNAAATGSGPVPAISTPPGGIQRGSAATRKPSPPISSHGGTHPVLTAFIISCRINSAARDLVSTDSKPTQRTAAGVPNAATAMNREVHDGHAQ